jgi:prepilin-type N-terminal cleavage/methylation domain-containing protein
VTRRADTYIGMDRFVCRRSSDEGFTLVELVVALTILAVGIVGVIGVTNSGFKVAGTASAKSKMVAAATREIEALRAIPYGELAADRNGDGLPDCGTVTTSPSWSCYSEATKKTGGISYKVQRTIKDYVRPTTSDPDDKHKVAVVAVLWTDQSGPHEVHQRATSTRAASAWRHRDRRPPSCRAAPLTRPAP